MRGIEVLRNEYKADNTVIGINIIKAYIDSYSRIARSQAEEMTSPVKVK